MVISKLMCKLMRKLRLTHDTSMPSKVMVGFLCMSPILSLSEGLFYIFPMLSGLYPPAGFGLLLTFPIKLDMKNTKGGRTLHFPE